MTALLEMFSSFGHAVLAGLLIAAICALLGVFVVLKRLVFIGAALSETAACGIAAAFFFGFHPLAGAFILTLAAVTFLAFSSREDRFPQDAVLAALFILTASLSTLFVAKSAVGLEEVKSLLYGDLVMTAPQDLFVLSAALLPCALVVIIFLRPLTYTFTDRDEARVLGIQVRFWELLFYYVLGIVVSAASKLGGMLLVFCSLTVPPMTGLLLCRRLKGVLLISILSAVAATLLGFYLSVILDLPVNQLIAFLNCLIITIALILRKLLHGNFSARAVIHG